MDPVLADLAPLSPLSVHGLRHTHATITLQLGENPVVVSKRLGHSTVTMTMNVYAHALPGTQNKLAENFASAIKRGSI